MGVKQLVEKVTVISFGVHIDKSPVCISNHHFYLD